jgi:hypothetical protein
MERMNIPIALEDAVFQQKNFRYFEDHKDYLLVHEVQEDGSTKEVKIQNGHLTHVTIVDPAKTAKMQSAESAILTIAVDRRSHRIFVRQIVSERFYPEQIYDEMFDQVQTFKSYILGYEVTGLNEFIIQPIESQCRIRSIFPQLMQLQAKRGVNEKGKIERIKTLAPLYNLGYMYHNANNCGPLEQQLLGFPRSKLWDVMDCLAYITFIMDKHSIHFDPEGDFMAEEDPEDDYDDLIDDDMEPFEEFESGRRI